MKTKPSVTGAYIHHITQILSIVLAFVWFGWQGGIVVFLINWSANTGDK